jgi:hypothetical protein
MKRAAMVFALSGLVVAAAIEAAPLKEFKAELQAAGSTLALAAPVTGVVSARLVVAGPDGFRVEKAFTGSEPIAVSLSEVKNSQGQAVPFVDGRYTWELRLRRTSLDVVGEAPVALSAAPGARAPAAGTVEEWVASGRLVVRSGSIVPVEDPKQIPAVGFAAAGSSSAATGGSGASAHTEVSVRPLTAFSGNLYVTGGIGAGCADGDGDVYTNGIMMKGSTFPYLELYNTSVPQKWQLWDLGAGDFGLSDATVYPLYVEHATPDHTLYLAANGTVGIGTSAPSTNLGVGGLDIVQPDFPAVRLNPGGTATKMDLYASSEQFGIFDEAADFSPFVVMQGSGNVGIGTIVPSALLDVAGSGGGNIARVAGGALLVQRTDGQAANIRFSATSGTTKSWLFINNPGS